jgi:hypothetical protein
MTVSHNTTSGNSSRIGGFLVGLCLLTSSSARAEPVAEQNDRVVRAETPIVAGNAVNAKKRALADAFRQVAERAFDALVKEGEPLPQPVPVAVAQLKASLANSAQKFIRSYRLIEQENEGGVLHVMVEADVNMVLLRRELDRARAVTQTPTPTMAAIPAAKFMLVAGSAPAAAMTAAALNAAGVSARPDPSSNEVQLVASAAKLNAFALFVTAGSTGEGLVRGAFRASVKCSLNSRLYQAGSQARRGPAIDRTDTDHGFAADETLARTACLTRASTLAAREIVAALHAPTVTLPYVTLQLDIVDLGAIPIFLQALKRVGAVTAAEVRHVTANLAELRAFTRMGGAALLPTLLREVAGKLTVVPTQTTNDLLALRVRASDSSALEENH